MYGQHEKYKPPHQVMLVSADYRDATQALVAELFKEA
jgi:hypothetical protein